MAERDAETEVDVELMKLARKVFFDPKTRMRAMKLVKEVEPELHVADLAAEEAVEAATKPLRDEIVKLQERDRERDALLNIEARRKPLRDKGLGDTDIAKIEKLMTEKKILDHEAAYEFMSLNEKVAAPTPLSVVPVKVQDLGKDFYKNPTQAARTEAARVLDDIRQGKLKAF